MALVQVVDRRFNSELPEQADASDAEDLLLNDPSFGRSAVEVPGDQPVHFIKVPLAVRIQQIEADPSDFCQPGLGEHLASADAYRNIDPPAICVQYRRQRKFRSEHVLVLFLLPAVVPQMLAEISVSIKQPDSDERYVEIAGGFEMVASQYSEPARICRQGIMNTVFRAEVCCRAVDTHRSRRVRLYCQVCVVL